MQAGERAAKEFFENESGRTRTALFEEVTEEGLLTGYTENYVRVYAKADGDPEDHLNEFFTVIMGGPFEDGMTAEIIEK
jgi:threonylcarbamoyladenosine tRNA methylthiotransferase MtaB